MQKYKKMWPLWTIASAVILLIFSSCSVNVETDAIAEIETSSEESKIEDSIDHKETSCDNYEQILKIFCNFQNIDMNHYENGSVYGGNEESRLYQAFPNPVLIQLMGSNSDTISIPSQILSQMEIAVLEWKRYPQGTWNYTFFYKDSDEKQWHIFNSKYETAKVEKDEKYIEKLTVKEINSAIDYFCENVLYLQDISLYSSGEKLGYSEYSRIYNQADSLILVDITSNDASLYLQAKENYGETIVSAGKALCLVTYQNMNLPGMLHLLIRENASSEWSYCDGGY